MKKPLLLCLFLTAVLFSCDTDFKEDFTVDSIGNVGILEDTGGENYDAIVENPFVLTTEESTSTFSIDADGGAYANVRRYLNDGILPPPNAVRTEELINYFEYDYPEPTLEDPHPLAIVTEVGACPWTPAHKLIKIGIKGKNIPTENLPPANMVFLIDVSGSMSASNKLPLLKEGFKLLAEELRAEDNVAIVTYAGKAGVALPSTSGSQKSKIIKAIDELGAGGSTAGSEGILTAYEIAEENFVVGGNNRVLLASDGDFNVGITSKEDLIKLIEEQREKGIFLTTLGFGSGNLNDANMEQLANNGNGTYEYIDDISQARKVFVEEFGKLYTVAKDVKVQIDFDPILVKKYRLIGYENRVLDNQDFEDDKKDAGELGSNQTVTAFYEVELIPRTSYLGIVPLNVRFRYKLPDSDVSELMVIKAIDYEKEWEEGSENYRFAASVASFSLLLRDSQYKGETSYDRILEWASDATNYDPNGYRFDFLDLIEKAKKL
ncbi:MAG: VWA domain-containing protein [Chitinophagales bacterium]